MKKRRLDWLFWVGVAYLTVLLTFAIIGPNLKHSHDAPAMLNEFASGVMGEAEANGMIVMFVNVGTPAHGAGLRPTDLIVSVDGRSLAGLDSESCNAALRGPRGSVVKVKVSRAGVVQTVEIERTIEVSAAPFTPPSSSLWLGADEQGRDVFARLAYGARMSLLIGFSVQAIALFFGILMGTLGVYAPTWVRVPVLRLTDGMFAFPDILLAILIVGVWNKRFEAMIVALAITAWPAVARLVRTQIATLKEREYVVASRALGASTPYLVVKHILPHLWGVILSVAMIDVAGVILAESALSFLGIGIQPPTPSWGAMIEMGRANMNSNPIMLLWPCLALSLTVFALNFVGDGLRALADPRSN